jgi:hypothetical protein
MDTKANATYQGTYRGGQGGQPNTKKKHQMHRVANLALT